MKKKILVVVSFLMVVILTVGGTVAYLTDSDKDFNVMTLGNVSIVQNEQQRDENGDLEAFENGKKLLPAVYDELAYSGSITVNGTEYTNVFTNGEGIENVVDKIVTVTNDGSEAAYVRTLIAYEDTDGIAAKMHMTFSSDHSYNLEYPTDENGNYVQFVKDGATYTVAVFTYYSPLQPGATSAPSLMQLFWDKSATNEDLAKAGANYEVIVLSQAVQASGWTDAKVALNEAFGEVAPATAATVAEWFDATPVETNGQDNTPPVTDAAALQAALDNGENVKVLGTVAFEGTPADKYGFGEDYAVNFTMTNGGTLTGGALVASPDRNASSGLFLNSEAEWEHSNGAAAVVSDLTITANLRSAIHVQAISNTITLNNVTVNNDYGIGVYAQYGGSTVVLNDCMITAADAASAAEDWQKTAVAAAVGADVEINGGTYTGKYAVYVFSTGGTITINDGAFVGDLKADAGSIVINGGTFTVDPTTVASVTVNGTVTEANGVWTVSAN